MTTPSAQEFSEWIGRTVYDGSGEKLGKVGRLWSDEDTGAPTWVTVDTGLFGRSEAFVPVQGMRARGDDLQTPHPKDRVEDAPRYDPERGHLDEDEQDRLYSYYGVPADPTDQDDEAVAKPRESTGAPAGTPTDTGYDVSGPTTDDAMTVSEERLRVGTRRQEAGRARLRKHVVTETESVEVPVTREEVRVEREPITEENLDAALSGPEISEEEHEMPLHEERPVTHTEAVPVERVRLAKDQVSDTETVTGEVRKERIDTDDTGDSTSAP